MMMHPRGLNEGRMECSKAAAATYILLVGREAMVAPTDPGMKFKNADSSQIDLAVDFNLFALRERKKPFVI